MPALTPHDCLYPLGETKKSHVKPLLPLRVCLFPLRESEKAIASSSKPLSRKLQRLPEKVDQALPPELPRDGLYPSRSVLFPFPHGPFSSPVCSSVWNSIFKHMICVCNCICTSLCICPPVCRGKCYLRAPWECSRLPFPPACRGKLMFRAPLGSPRAALFG